MSTGENSSSKKQQPSGKKLAASWIASAPLWINDPQRSKVVKEAIDGKEGPQRRWTHINAFWNEVASLRYGYDLAKQGPGLLFRKGLEDTAPQLPGQFFTASELGSAKKNCNLYNRRSERRSVLQLSTQALPASASMALEPSSCARSLQPSRLRAIRYGVMRVCLYLGLFPVLVKLAQYVLSVYGIGAHQV